ncbi:MAG: helix-turn-helix domain-containing protein [Pyrinomonadaceae bacterium]
MPSAKKKQTIGEIIAEARKKSGLSLRALASRIPVSSTYLFEIENGKRTPSEKVVKGLSEQSELNLNFDNMMAHTGHIGEEAEIYLKKNPTFGNVIRKVARKNLNEDQLNSLHNTIDKLKP